MRRVLLLGSLSLLLPLSLYAEKSAFGAGDLNNPSPYGLTNTEKQILENKEIMQDIEGTVRKNRARISTVEESLSGIKSIVEGLNESGRDDTLKLQSFREEINAMKDSSAEMNHRIDEVILNHDEHIKQLKVVMGELSSLIDGINGTYVTKEEYNTLATEINNLKRDISKQLKNISTTSSSPLENKSNAQIEKDAEALFEKKKYADVIDSFEYLITKNYKPAKSHYYIGESYFQLNEYKNAVSYFKESANLYSKADYMPNLMLHTGICLKKTKDPNGAEQFFKALVAKYPESAEAKKAKTFLK